MRIRVGHLYPEYLNIYADRGNIAVLARRAALRGHELDVAAVGDRRHARARRRTTSSTSAAARIASRRSIAPDLAAQGRCDSRRPSTRGAACSRSAAATSCSAAATAAATGRSCRAPALFPHETVAGETAHDRRRPARVRARAGRAARRSPASRTTPGRTVLDAGAEPLGRVVARLRQRRRVGLRGLPARAARSARTSTGRCCRATRGSPTGCCRRRSRTRRAASRPSSSRCPTSSSARRSGWRGAGAEARRRR